MKKTLFAVVSFGAAMLAATGASAQTMAPGAELLDQTVNVVYADGTSNTVMFGEDGTAVIRASNGQTATANWFVQNNEICLQSSTAKECWPYSRRFAAGQSMALTSDCDSLSNWTPLSVAAAPMVAPVQTPAPMQQMPAAVPPRSGERG